jgi:hypothetical protein
VTSRAGINDDTEQRHRYFLPANWEIRYK